MYFLLFADLFLYSLWYSYIFVLCSAQDTVILYLTPTLDSFARLPMDQELGVSFHISTPLFLCLCSIIHTLYQPLTCRGQSPQAQE